MLCSHCNGTLDADDYYVTMQEVDQNTVVEQTLCELCFQLIYGKGGTA